MNNKILYYVLSFTWGIVMTLIGGVVALALLIVGYKPERSRGQIHFQVGNSWGGVSLGLVTITSKNPTTHTLNHEFGHSIQNCWFGPLWPFLVGIPSGIRYWYREISYRIMRSKKEAREITQEEYNEWIKNRPAYDDIWFEGQATKLGDKYSESWL